MLKACTLAASLLMSAPFAALAQEPLNPDTIVVLDVSNSMWGQIDGVSKIEIARDVIADLVGELDSDTQFGLVAYGHRRKSDCTDIELVLPVGPLNAAQFSSAVNSLVPRGRTPLTDAVKQAAEVLNYQERPGRIVLVSDGLESCDADPCALAAELAKNGLDFTTHVVGFDVAGIDDQSQLSCLAEQTGGLYLTAESTQELATALTTMMVTEVIPTPTPPVEPPFAVYLQAPAEVEVNTVFQATWAATARPGDQILLLPANGTLSAALASVDPTSGSPAAFTAPAEIGEYVLVYVDKDGKEFARAAVTVVQKVTLSGPETAIAGSPVQIAWSGPSAERDFITIVAVGAAVGAYNDYAYIGDISSPATINSPDTVGAFEIRFVSANSTTILASQPITLTEPTVSLDTVETANAGASIDVAWVGPNFARDFITIVEVGAPDTSYNSYAYTTAGSPARITTLDQPGTFEIRYVSGQSNTIWARRLITLEDVTVSLDAVESAIAGSSIDITWKGPNAERDFVTIVAPDASEGSYNGYGYTKDGTTLRVKTPDTAGVFEVRYVSGQSNATLARRPIMLTAPVLSLNTVDTAIAGTQIEVFWEGPNNERDFLTVVAVGAPLGAYEGYGYTEDGSPAVFATPDQPGSYEVRYVSAQSNATLASRPITLTAPVLSLSTVDTAIAGAKIEVLWEGPNNERDFVTIVAAGAPVGSYEGYGYTKDGSPAVFATPDQPGSYEIRYVSGQSNATLASRPISLTAPTILLEAQTPVFAGSAFAVQWIGPDFERDYIAISEAGSDASSYISYEYTREGVPLTFTAPEAAGTYELRYYSASNSVLGMIPLVVVAE